MAACKHVDGGQRLREISPRIVAVPRVNGSIFRLNRDTRFSSDPTPYKTNLGIYFWIGPWPRLESAGYYFHVEPPDFMVGGGVYMFPPAMIGPYRRAAADPRTGKELAKIVGVEGGDVRARAALHARRSPAARSCSCAMPARKDATSPGMRVAAARAITLPAGLRLFGMADEPPPASATSPTSCCMSSVMSRAIFPSAPT